MADKKNVTETGHNEAVIAKAKDFWTRYQKHIMIATAVIIIAFSSFGFLTNVL